MKQICWLMLVSIIPAAAFAQKKPGVVNFTVSDTATQKKTASVPPSIKPVPKPTSAPGALSSADSLFFGLIKDVLALRDKYASLQKGSDEKKDDRKTDTFGFLSMREKIPISIYKNNLPYQDDTELKKLPATKTAKVPQEALLKSIEIGKVQLYLQTQNIVRMVIFSGEDKYQSIDKIKLEDVNDKSKFTNFKIDGKDLQIRINDLLTYTPWHDTGNVKEDIYVLTNSQEIILSIQK